MRYRVNYGNGQVEYPGDKRACLRWIANLTQYQSLAFVEWRDPDTGEWFRTGNA